MASTPMVIEGVRTAVSALQLASRAGVETPIIAQVHAVLHENKPPAAAIQALLARDLKREEG
jgi:glycerol-3-phosphate dehydrogenase (NAD(P)+)